MAADDSQAVLHVYGKDRPTSNGQSMREHLLSLLDDAPRRRVKFHGHCDRQDIFAALRSARLAVFPSYAEAFALAPLESMGLGCPTIASSRGAGSELMEHGQHGLLVDPDNHHQIAESMLLLLSDDQLAQRLGRAGRQRVLETFTIDRLRRQNEQFYDHCIDQFSQAG